MDPGSPEAADVARRWMAQVRLATGGDPATTARLGHAWHEAVSRPDVAPDLPFGPEVWTFVNEAVKRLCPA